jgi:zinc-binding alcohol dehydrogenase family protein
VSVNPVDVKERASAPSLATPRILGWDAAGVVRAVGAEVTLFHPGDQVYYAGDLDRPGSNSYLQAVDERIVGRKPATLDFAQAAALPLTTLTAWESLFDRLSFIPEPGGNSGRSALILGASGGVGSIATQLAHWAGLTVIGTASRPASREWALAHGADVVIDHRQSLVDQLAAVGVATVDAVVILNGGGLDRLWADIIHLIAPQGGICNIDYLPSGVDLAAGKVKSIRYVWELMYTRSLYQTPDMLAQHHILNRVADLVDAGAIQSTLTTRLAPFTAATLRQAHALVESGAMIGKVVMERSGAEL